MLLNKRTVSVMLPFLFLFSFTNKSYSNIITGFREAIDTTPANPKSNGYQTFGATNTIGGSVMTPNGIIVNAVKMNVNGGETDSLLTGNSGNYSFSVPTGGNYIVKADRHDSSSKRTNGVTVLDAVLIQAHILGKIPLNTSYKLIAADVNNDGKISVIDILLLKRFILGLDTAFKGNRLWAFVDSSYQFPNPSNPFPFKDSLSYTSINGNKTNQTFIGVKLGDVNNDWQREYTTVSKTDTLKVVAHNILHYGDGCQGSLTTLNGYFKTIVQYENPDILSCEKVNAFTPTSTSETKNFALSIRDSVLNAVFPNKYDFATPTNVTGSSDMTLLFYNKQKLSYLKTETLISNTEDFDMHKLYYNDDNLYYTHDTTFLYVVVNHTISGNSSTGRDQQITQEMAALRSKFTYFPNLINMGDFNMHNSSEGCYQAITSKADSTTMMSDPPFSIDNKVQYPADWDNNPQIFKPFLTTSTRLSGSIPNGCGTSGGAKSWYDHIFISPWLVKGTNYMQYIPNSYQTIGNDGNRLGVDINSTSPVVNNSAPTAVINALFQLSNKYPITIQLKVTTNTTSTSPVDPLEK